MSDVVTPYPENSVLAQIQMNIYAHKENHTVTILYGETFSEELLGLEYNPATRDLFFQFKPGTMPYGRPMSDDIHTALLNTKIVTLLEMDLKTEQPVLGLEAPLTLLE